MASRRRYIVLCTTCLFLGMCCYIFFRPDSLISVLFSKLSSFSIHTIVTESIFLQCYAADFLWGLAFSFGLLAIHMPNSMKCRLLCCGIAVLSGCVWELLQHLKVVNGTGDLVDAVMYLSAGSIAAITPRKERIKHENF